MPTAFYYWYWYDCLNLYYAGIEIGFNDSDLVTTKGQSEPTNVCVQITSGVLQRNVSVYLETLSVDGGGGLSDIPHFFEFFPPLDCSHTDSLTQAWANPSNSSHITCMHNDWIGIAQGAAVWSL